MNLTITQLGIMHLNDCLDLDQKSLKGLWTESQWERELTDAKRICIGIIDLETKNLLGFCSGWLVIDELHITSIAVDPIHQRKGIGKSLMSNIIKRSSSHHITLIHLEVKNTNEAAKAFYKTLGFKFIGNRPNFYKDGSEAIIFTKQLN